MCRPLIFISLKNSKKRMDFDDLFKPYSFVLRGDLQTYLQVHNGCGVDNLFHGSEHFFEIQKNGWMKPNITMVRVDQSPAPDIAYMVNSSYKLESRGRGEENMSLVGAHEGIYEPKEVLDERNWSIYHLYIEEE